MRFHSTNSPSADVSLEEALFHSMPPDLGLYMPNTIPTLGSDFFERIAGDSLADIGYAVSEAFLGQEIPRADLEELVHNALSFETPVLELEPGKLSVLELFHGPSLAFKDVGARYMAALMSYYSRSAGQEIDILVATSGDTGGAVAMGFHNVPGVRVSILYPSGRVSDLQEKQLTTLGGNIQAFEVAGSFDDCQAIVKQAFVDKELNQKVALSSANSINIFRLLPQSFYYVSAYGQVRKYGKPVVFSIPSGNFGNLSAGVLAYRMGLPVEQFVASTNENRVVPAYLTSGTYLPEATVATISNAMDVGNPSNFIRLMNLFCDDIQAMRAMVSGFFFSDEETRVGMSDIYQRYKYITCPHTAIGLLGAEAYQRQSTSDAVCIALATAHPAKFKPLVESVLDTRVVVPERLDKHTSSEKHSIQIPADYEPFKEAFLQTVS